MSKRDYYEVMKHHPDRNEGDASAEKKFKEAKEAFDVLSDPQKKAAYDQYGHAGVDPSMGGGGHGGAGAHGFGDAFSDIFGDIFNGGGGSNRQQRRGADLRYDMTLTLEEAVNGVEKQISVPRNTECSTCDGTGGKKGSKPKTCGTCGGVGQVRMSQGFFSVQQECPHCDGKGTVISDPCGTCHGSGLERETKKLSVKIPAGVDNGDQIRLSGEGESAQGGVRGDLYVSVNVKKHAIFEREGVDLFCKVPISYASMALGGELEVPTLGGRAKLKIPAGTQSGKQFRLKGKGVSNVRQQGYVGDLYCQIQVETPVNLTKEQKELLKQLDDSIHSGGSKHSPEESSWSDKIKSFFDGIV